MKRCKFLKNSIFLLLLSFAIHSFGQNSAITEVMFDFRHSLRIPNHYVTVDMDKIRDTVTVHVISTPLQNSSKWNRTKRDYSFVMAVTDFESIVTLVASIRSSDIVDNAGFSGRDGTTCDIEFGGSGTTVKYNVWSPDFETKERKLQSFLEACRLILQMAKLDPNKIL